MSRFRWGLGLVLVALSIASAVRALEAYVAHGLWLGSATVVLLAAIAVFGLGSLFAARRRIGRELLDLGADVPGGELWSARRKRLESIRARGANPDREALADAVAADERGRAYLGRYLVAVTVLVGLVGTFAGLMETLRTVAPLLRDEQGATLQRIAAPLGGLDVTFGASIVGILVTLALALVQGDLIIAEEQALARLEERTTHELVPSLWPPAESAAERTARELAALRSELGRVLVDASERSAGRVAALAKTEIDRLVAEVAGSLSATAQETARRIETGVATAVTGVEEKLTPLLRTEAARIEDVRRGLEQARAAAHATAAEVQKLAAAVVAAQAEATASARTAQTEATARANAAQAEATAREERATARFAAAQDDLAGRLDGALRELTAAHASALRVATDETTGALRSAIAATSGALEAAAAKNAAALGTLVSGEAAAIGASVERAERALTAVTNETARVLTAATAEATRAVHTASSEANLAIATTAGQAQISLAAAASQAVDALAGGSSEAARVLALATSEAAGALAKAGVEVSRAAESSLGGMGGRLEAAASALGTAASELGAVLAALRPELAALSPELSALTREVALLAARTDEGEPLVLDELVRLGHSVERVEALVRLAQGGGA